MLGRKPVSRELDGASLAEAMEALLRQGFVEHDVGDGYALLKKPGTSLTTKAHRYALEAALTEKDGSVQLQVGYDAFVAFDSGDLDTEADRIVRVIHG